MTEMVKVRRAATNPLAAIGLGMIAGIAGTVVMTAFQRFVEMPLTQREDSYAPADLAEKLLPVHPTTPEARRRLNWVTHFAIGALLWGATYGLAAAAGLRGQKAVSIVFVVVYASDIALNTALGLAKPTTWSVKEWTIDIVNKYVQGQATGLIFDRVLDPARTP